MRFGSRSPGNPASTSSDWPEGATISVAAPPSTSIQKILRSRSWACSAVAVAKARQRHKVRTMLPRSYHSETPEHQLMIAISVYRDQILNPLPDALQVKRPYWER